MAQQLLSRSVRGVFRRSSYLISPTPAISTFSVTSLQGSAPTLHSQSITKPLSNTDRSFSSYNANPSYQIYGENTAFTMKSIMPGFKIVGSKTVIVDNNKKGRLLLEFTPRTSSEGRFAWDQAIKFALSAEEVGTLLSRLSNSHTVEFARQTGQSGNPQYGFHNEDMGQGTLQKVFRAIPNPDGTVQFSIDYELEGRGGQDPPNPQESHGPLEISLMAGEFQVTKSLMEYAMPRLVGWPQMMDRPLDQLLQTDSMQSPHNYSSGGGGNNVPF